MTNPRIEVSHNLYSEGGKVVGANLLLLVMLEHAGEGSTVRAYTGVVMTPDEAAALADNIREVCAIVAGELSG